MPTADERRQIRTIVGGIGRLTERTVIALALDVEANLKETTPVDTGWARANWIPSVRAPVEAPIGSPGNVTVATDAQVEGERSLLGFRLRHRFAWITNNVPYILRLNEGHSSQAEAGFVQRAIRKAVTRLR